MGGLLSIKHVSKGRYKSFECCEKGVDMDAKDEDGYTALHCVAESRHANVIEMLVKKEADAEARTNKGLIALQIAECLHYVGITRILIHRGATKNNINMAHILNQASVSFGKKSMGLEEEIIKGGMKKKKSSRARALRGNFDFVGASIVRCHWLLFSL